MTVTPQQIWDAIINDEVGQDAVSFSPEIAASQRGLVDNLPRILEKMWHEPVTTENIIAARELVVQDLDRVMDEATRILESSFKPEDLKVLADWGLEDDIGEFAAFQASFAEQQAIDAAARRQVRRLNPAAEALQAQGNFTMAQLLTVDPMIVLEKTWF